MKVQDLYSPMTVVATPGEGLTEAASRMRFNDIGSVAVVQGDELVGIITERDLARALADGVDARQITVAEYMTPEPAVVAPETDADEAARVMIGMGIRHLPVVSPEEGLIGLVSVRDILAELIWSGS